MNPKVILALGSNLGESADILVGAVEDLADHPLVHLLQVSPLAKTRAVGGPKQPDYLNMVIEVETKLTPDELLTHTQAVEEKYHRERIVRWGPRTLDVDIISFGDVSSNDESLTLPHPRAQERAFVLAPWSWMDPSATLCGRPVAELAAAAADFPDLERYEGAP